MGFTHPPKARRVLVVLLAFLVAAIAAAPSAHADRRFLRPSADSYVNVEHPTHNLGTLPLLAVSRSPAMRTYLRFSLGSAVAKRVRRATLYLYSMRASSRGIVVMHASNRGFGERSITYAHKPRTGSQRIRSGPLPYNSWRAINVTRLLDHDSDVELALLAVGNTRAIFRSREMRFYEPRLVLDMKGTPASTVITRPAPISGPWPVPGAGVPPVGPPGPPGSPGPSRGGALHSTSTQAFVDAHGNAVKMRSVEVQPLREGAAQFKQIAAKGFTGVRFTMPWADYEPSPGKYANLAGLDAAVTNAKAAGLYVIMDCIHIDGGHSPPGWASGSDTLDKVRQATGWVKTLAARYAAEPAVAGYDLINEPPRTSSQMNSILDVYNVLIGAVRSVDPEKIVLLNAPWGNNDPRPGDLGRVGNRHNLVWTFHDYFAGGDDDGYSSSGGQAGTWVWDGKTGYPSPNPTELENYVKVQVNWAANWGVPSWVGEFGIGNGAQNRDRWIQDQVALFNKYGLGYNWWEFNAHGGWPFGATDSNYHWFPFVDLLFR